MFPSLRRQSSVQSDDSDPELMRRVAKGDKRALEAMYRAYQPRLARFLSRYTRSEALIEEVINDTFWIVWQKADGYRGDARVSTWIIGITYRLAMKAFRDQDDLSRHEGDHDFETLLQHDPGADRELSDWIGKGLKLLSIDQRSIVELVYGQGHTLEEAATIMACPVGTAKSWLFHARVRLRNLLPDLAGQAIQANASMGDGHER